MEYCSKKSFTGELEPIFTCLDELGLEHTEEHFRLMNLYEKKRDHEQTLVFEMIDTMVKIIDPYDNDFSRHDQNIYNITVDDEEGKSKCLLLKFHPGPLMKVLEKFSESYELIVYTILPRSFINIILQ